MKNLLLASLAGFALASGSALAADMAIKAPAPAPAPAPAASWTGCYVDGGAGYGMWNQDHYFESYPGLVAEDVTTTSGGRGWYGTVGGGCDYQLNSQFVIGALADYDFMSLKGTVDDPLFEAQGSENETGAWAVGGRIGYLVTPSFMTYINGGYTAARFGQVNIFTPNLVPWGNDIGAHTYNGWFLGGGTETTLSFLPAGWFLRSDYRYAAYQAADLPIVNTTTGMPIGLAEHSQKYVQTIGTELVYKFNWTGPVSAKY